MRDIKFRAWDKEIKVMRDHDYFFESSPHYQNPFTRNDIILMQFTGLKDKNGLEIYEGDIIKVKKELENDDLLIKEVSFEKGTFTIGQSLDDGSRIWCSMKTYLPFELEVLGNIYEHTELLTPSTIQI